MSLKKFVYYALWYLLGIMLGFVAAGILILISINIWGFDYYLMAILLTALTVGLVFGAWAAPLAWQKIYVEGARGSQYVHSVSHKPKHSELSKSYKRFDADKFLKITASIFMIYIMLFFTFFLLTGFIGAIISHDKFKDLKCPNNLRATLEIQN